MSSVAVLMPAGLSGDGFENEWREAAQVYTVRWWRDQFPTVPIHIGRAPAGPWSKGAAIAAALELTSAEVLVLADADSFVFDPRDMGAAIQAVRLGRAPWATPHGKVYRLDQRETSRLYGAPAGARPRLGCTCRPIYEGIAGGGIVVVAREALELVGGIDRRFLGWGGEDVAFGYALETLAGPRERIDGAFVHLWHPHPAPELRGSPESEALLDQYKAARGVTRRMRAVVAGESWAPAEQLADPVRFRMTANRNTVHLPSGEYVRFVGGIYETTDPDELEQLRRFPILREEPRR